MVFSFLRQPIRSLSEFRVSDTFSPRHIGSDVTSTFCRGPPFAVDAPGLDTAGKWKCQKEITENHESKKREAQKNG